MSESLIIQNLQPAAVAQADNDNQLVALWLRSHRSEKTRREYDRDIARLFSWLFSRMGGAANKISYLRLADLQDYAESLADKSPNTQRRMLASIKSLFTFACKIGFLQCNVAAAIQLPRAKNVLAERILSEADVLKMIVMEPKPRNQLLLRLFYLSGARLEELRQLRWRDLQARENAGQVTLYGKGEKTRAVRLPAKLYADLSRARLLIPYGAPSDFIFPRKRDAATQERKPLDATALWRIVSEAASRAGIIGKVSPHWLRHAHASHAIEKGASIVLVQETLGHESLTTTTKYTHARPEDSSGLYLSIE